MASRVVPNGPASRFPLLLREVGVQKGATWILAEGADASGNERSLPMRKAMEDILVAYGQNGEALRPENGYPLRLSCRAGRATSTSNGFAG